MLEKEKEYINGRFTPFSGALEEVTGSEKSTDSVAVEKVNGSEKSIDSVAVELKKATDSKRCNNKKTAKRTGVLIVLD